MQSPGSDAMPFNPDNTAWRRFLSLVHRNFSILVWEREDGRPHTVTLIDPDSGDGFSVGVLDSIEDHDPHAILALGWDGRYRAHGPVRGTAVARLHMRRLGATAAMTAAFRLHDPTEPGLPATSWSPPLPVGIPLPGDTAADSDTTTTGSGATTVVVFIDRDARMALAGPFNNTEAATHWQPGSGATTVVVPLYPIEAGHQPEATTFPT